MSNVFDILLKNLPLLPQFRSPPSTLYIKKALQTECFFDVLLYFFCRKRLKTFTFWQEYDKISKGLGENNMISYSGLEKLLKQRGVTKTDMANALGISSRTIAKISKGEKLSRIVIEKICGYLGCDPSDICREVSPNHILQILRDEKDAKISGGLYHELQVRMTYNSNHIEGSRLSEDQTRLIFETNTLNIGDGISVDDVLETVHHFRAIDECIDHAEDTLSEEFIKNLHYILKHDTKDSRLDWFAVGDYKKRANIVGGQETTKPKDVPAKMKHLLEKYNAKESVTIYDIIALHSDFEHIHPFQDGNGRVGRLIAFKECLENNIVPFIIFDDKKLFYYRGLKNWDKEHGWLIDTCLDGQDTVKGFLDYFHIQHK